MKSVTSFSFLAAFLAIFLVVFPLSVDGQGDPTKEISVTAKGIGRTSDEALADAFKNESAHFPAR